MKFALFHPLLVAAFLGLAACHRGATPTGAPRPAVPPVSPGQTATGTPGTTKPGLPDFAVQPVRTEEGTAEWYDVPEESLAARRAWPGEMTAASDVLPQNTYARVTLLAPEKGNETTRPVVVRVTDNGVHKKAVLIEVDHEAARALGIVKAGEAKVRVEILALRSATTDKPVEKKGASTAPQASKLTATGAVDQQAEEDAAKKKEGATTPPR